jgi:hypothetical protein
MGLSKSNSGITVKILDALAKVKDTTTNTFPFASTSASRPMVVDGADNPTTQDPYGNTSLSGSEALIGIITTEMMEYVTINLDQLITTKLGIVDSKIRYNGIMNDINKGIGTASASGLISGPVGMIAAGTALMVLITPVTAAKTTCKTAEVALNASLTSYEAAIITTINAQSILKTTYDGWNQAKQDVKTLENQKDILTNTYNKNTTTKNGELDLLIEKKDRLETNKTDDDGNVITDNTKYQKEIQKINNSISTKRQEIGQLKSTYNSQLSNLNTQITAKNAVVTAKSTLVTTARTALSAAKTAESGLLTTLNSSKTAYDASITALTVAGAPLIAL